MSRGLIVIGGGEEEQYDIINEKELRPIINVEPSEDDVFEKLKWVIDHPEALPRLSHESVEYIRTHHDHKKVADQYLRFWNNSHGKSKTN